MGRKETEIGGGSIKNIKLYDTCVEQYNFVNDSNNQTLV